MMEYIIGHSHYYVFIIALCFLLCDEAFKTFCLIITSLILIDNITSPYIRLQYEDYFFHSKVIIDLLWIAMTIIYAPPNYRIKISVVCIISALVNIYLCLDKSYNFIYEYWNSINFILFEVIILFVLSGSPLAKYVEDKMKAYTINKLKHNINGDILNGKV